MSSGKPSAGEAIRREVMGTEHVDRSLGQATDFDLPLQEMTMEHGWGSAWTRDGLDRRREVSSPSRCLSRSMRTVL